MTDLVLERISHAFDDGTPVVRELSLSVPAGHIVCLLGPSGCGKTTTLRLAAGLERLQAGRIRIGDRLVAGATVHVPPEHRDVGLVFQDFALFPHLTAAQNVAFGLRRGNAAERRGIAIQYLERVGMARFADAFPHTLSGGEQQRVALARALAPRPAAMLLDEPFSGLDTRLREAVRDDTLALLRGDVATLMVTHDPEEAMYMADAIALMRAGRIVQVGSPTEVYNHPADRFVAEFLSETNAVAGRVGEDRVVRTAYGDIGPVALAPGTTVDVLFRPEAVELNGLDAGAAAAEVLSVRALGPTALIELRGPNPHPHLRARLPAGRLPRAGDRVGVAMKTAQALVFPRQDEA